MLRILINSVIIFSIICCELKSVNSTIKSHHNLRSVRSSLNTLQNEDVIRLTDLRRPIIISQNEIEPDNCAAFCDYFNPTRNTKPKEFKGVSGSKCNGWLDSCRHFSTPNIKNPPTYCYLQKNRDLIWAKDRFYTKFKDTNEKCVEKSLRPIVNSTINNYECHTCLCMCTDGSDDSKSIPNWAFSLLPQISDIDNNRIVTGVRFRTHEKLIYLQIKEGEIGSNDEDNWKSFSFPENLKPNIDYSFLEPNSRFLNLDVIHVPSDRVITGVKFTNIPILNEGKNGWNIEMEVQGTKFDVTTGELIMDMSDWYSARNSNEPSTDYDRYRKQISMNHQSLNSLSTHADDKFYESNTYIKFGSPEQSSMTEKFIIPYLNASNVQCERMKMLNGIGLLYKGKEGYVGSITPRIFVNEFLDNYTNRTSRITSTTSSDLEEYDYNEDEQHAELQGIEENTTTENGATEVTIENKNVEMLKPTEKTVIESFSKFEETTVQGDMIFNPHENAIQTSERLIPKDTATLKIDTPNKYFKSEEGKKSEEPYSSEVYPTPANIGRVTDEQPTETSGIKSTTIRDLEEYHYVEVEQHAELQGIEENTTTENGATEVITESKNVEMLKPTEKTVMKSFNESEETTVQENMILNPHKNTTNQTSSEKSVQFTTNTIQTTGRIIPKETATLKIDTANKYFKSEGKTNEEPYSSKVDTTPANIGKLIDKQPTETSGIESTTAIDSEEYLEYGKVEQQPELQSPEDIEEIKKQLPERNSLKLVNELVNEENNIGTTDIISSAFLKGNPVNNIYKNNVNEKNVIETTTINDNLMKRLVIGESTMKTITVTKSILKEETTEVDNTVPTTEKINVTNTQKSGSATGNNKKNISKIVISAVKDVDIQELHLFNNNSAIVLKIPIIFYVIIMIIIISVA